MHTILNASLIHQLFLMRIHQKSPFSIRQLSFNFKASDKSSASRFPTTFDRLEISNWNELISYADRSQLTQLCTENFPHSKSENSKQSSSIKIMIILYASWTSTVWRSAHTLLDNATLRGAILGMFEIILSSRTIMWLWFFAICVAVGHAKH